MVDVLAANGDQATAFIILASIVVPLAVLAVVCWNMAEKAEFARLLRDWRSAVVLLATFGLTLVEALCAGSAVVGTPAGGIPEVILDGRTGLLAREGDAEHLAEQLERLLTDDALRARLTEAGQAHVRDRYAPATTARTFLDLYHALARNHPTR